MTRKRFDGVIAPTEKMREALVADWGITNDWAQIDVVPTGIDISRMQNGDNARFRAKYGIRDDENVLLYLGRIGTESEVSAAIVFLLSPAAAFISGACLRIDGAAPNANRVWERPQGAGTTAPFDGFHLASRPKVLD